MCVHQLLRLYLRVRDGLCPGLVPAYPPGGDTSAGSFGNGLPFCAMHMRVSSVSLRLPSLISSAILAQYSSLCDHLVLQFNLG